MNRKKGFTLIELLAVIVVLAVIALIASPMVMKYINESKEDGVETSLKSIERAAKLYFTDNNVKNDTVVDLTGNQIKLGGQKISKGYVIGNRKKLKVYIYKDEYCGYSDGKDYTIKKTTIDECDFTINDLVEIATTNKIEKSKTISGYRIYGNTENNISLGESSNAITLKLRGKNILDKSQFKQAGLQNETGVQAWGEVLTNDWVVNNLKPSTIYTITFDATCVNVPEYNSTSSGNFGFYLYSGVSGYSNFWLNISQSKYFSLNDSISSTKTITTPATLHDSAAKYKINGYTNRYLKDSVGVNSTFIFKNIQIEEGSTATAYEPYITPQEYTITLSDPLRKIEGAVDYIDSSINQIVRNVGVNVDGSLYALDKPTYEYIELPSINNLDGTTIVSVTDGSIEPSNLEIILAK